MDHGAIVPADRDRARRCSTVSFLRQTGLFQAAYSSRIRLRNPGEESLRLGTGVWVQWLEDRERDEVAPQVAKGRRVGDRILRGGGPERLCLVVLRAAGLRWYWCWRRVRSPHILLFSIRVRVAG